MKGPGSAFVVSTNKITVVPAP